MEQLIAYGRHTDPVFYAMRFVDGLHDDIRNSVHMHRPSTLDSACALALWQEEMADSNRRREIRKLDPYVNNKQVPRPPLPVPPPPRPDKASSAATPPSADDRRPRGLED